MCRTGLRHERGLPLTSVPQARNLATDTRGVRRLTDGHIGTLVYVSAGGTDMACSTESLHSGVATSDPAPSHEHSPDPSHVPIHTHHALS